MRKGLGILAVCLGTVSILLTARYGWKQADETIDQLISATIFGAISLCAFVFDAVAVQLWFRGLRKGAAFIAIIAGAAFVVTFSNSLGGIASRGDAVTAGRQAVVDDQEDNHAELKRLQGLLRDLKFVPADEAAVKAAAATVAAATAAKEAECDKRGPLCKEWENKVEKAAAVLATVTANKATTDVAREYEAKIENVKKALAADRSKNVGAANSWAKAVSEMFGAWAASLASWQQAAIALVFDLCLLGVMVSFAMLGELAPPERAATAKESEPKPAVEAPSPQLLPRPAKPRLVTKAEPYKTDVHRIMKVALAAAKGERVDLGQCLQRYQTECGAQCTPNEFMLCVVAYCKASNIRTKEIGGRIYLLDVKLAPAISKNGGRPRNFNATGVN
jgi:hypothetical protein